MRLPPPLLLALLAAAAVVFSGAAWGGASEERDKPIIAQLMHDAGSYDGAAVTIYGLVIEARDGGRAFLLQDVSQMPLRVHGREGIRVKVGDQLLITGIFHANEGDPYLEGRLFVPTKVLGGGGCC
jgi:hypothetical protein